MLHMAAAAEVLGQGRACLLLLALCGGAACAGLVILGWLFSKMGDHVSRLVHAGAATPAHCRSTDSTLCNLHPTSRRCPLHGGGVLLPAATPVWVRASLRLLC